MTSSSDPIDTVSQRLESFVAAQRSEAVALGPEAVDLVDAAASALYGGKRLRARFLAASWAAVQLHAGRDTAPGADVAGIAAALEVFHAAALVHDDLVDNSDTRRGRPSAHRSLEAHHRSSGWAGAAEPFGRAAAILLGDLLVAWSDDLLEASIDAAEHARAVRRQYAQMRRDVTIGQYLDVAEEAAYTTAPTSEHADRARRVATYKSARYSVQQPLLIGAALAGASDAQLGVLAEFGQAIGLAFQLRDDVLGVFGDSAVTGKPAGDDLREGKRTVLIAYAMEGTDAPGRAELDTLLGDRGLADDEIARAREIIVSSGALERLEREIADLSAQAESVWHGAPFTEPAVSDLRALGRAAVERLA